MGQSSYSDQILQYLQTQGKARSATIVQDVAVPRRRVFKILAKFIKAGLIYKEGLHPQVYYVARSIPTQPKPAAQAQAEPLQVPDYSKKVEYLQQKLTAALEEQTRLAKELSQARNEIYELKHKLNGKELDLKGALAKVNYQESQIKQVVEREKLKIAEVQRLRQEIEDLQAKLREEQRQKALKLN